MCSPRDPPRPRPPPNPPRPPERPPPNPPRDPPPNPPRGPKSRAGPGLEKPPRAYGAGLSNWGLPPNPPRAGAVGETYGLVWRTIFVVRAGELCAVSAEKPLVRGDIVVRFALVLKDRSDASPERRELILLFEYICLHGITLSIN